MIISGHIFLIKGIRMNSHKSIKTTLAALVLLSFSSVTTVQASTLGRAARVAGNSLLIFGGVTTTKLLWDNTNKDNRACRIAQILVSGYTALSGIDGIYNALFVDTDEEIDPTDIDDFDNDNQL